MFNRDINVFGLIPFIFIFLKYYSIIAFSILYNGIVYHGFHDSYIYIDMFFNTLFIIWVNIYTNYSLTFIITLFTIIFFFINYFIKSNLLHTLLVQWPFAYLLYYYYFTNSHENYKKQKELKKKNKNKI